MRDKLYVLFSTTPIEPQRGQTVLEAVERPYKSGADGYFLGGKVNVHDDGTLYQLSCNMVRIGSNLEPEAVDRINECARIETAKTARKVQLSEAKARVAAARAGTVANGADQHANG